MHWIVGQVLTMQAVLGAPIDADLAGLARAAAAVRSRSSADPLVRGWATVSLIEQALLELATNGPSADTSERAVELAQELMRAMGEDSEHVVATCRQMRRFAAWWGDPEFIEVERRFGVERVGPWDAEHGVVATADGGDHRPHSAAACGRTRVADRPMARRVGHRVGRCRRPLAAEPQASTTPGSATVVGRQRRHRAAAPTPDPVSDRARSTSSCSRRATATACG